MNEVFTLREGEWQVRLNGRVLATVWNSRGAALAGLRVEERRAAKPKDYAHACVSCGHHYEQFAVRCSSCGAFEAKRVAV
jgi:hypothetical protein